MPNTNFNKTYESNSAPYNGTTLSPEELKKSFTVVGIVFGTMIITSSIVTIIVIAYRRKQYPKSLPSFSYIIWRILPNRTQSNRDYSNSNDSHGSTQPQEHHHQDLECGAWRSSNPMNTQWITQSDEARLIQENRYNTRRWFRLGNNALYQGGSSQYPSTSFIENSSYNNNNNNNDKMYESFIDSSYNTRAGSIGTLIISAPNWLRRKIIEKYRCHIDNSDMTSLVVINPAVLSVPTPPSVSSHRDGYQNIDEIPQNNSHDTIIASSYR